MAIDWMQVVKDKETELSQLYARMDIDKGLYYIDAYTLKDAVGTKIPEVYSMTLPDARLYADKLIGDITSADIQLEITGDELEDRHASEIEKLLDDYIAVADIDLANLGVAGGLKGALPGQAAIRGWIYIKSFPHLDKGIFRPGLMIWDSRFASYESGLDGLNWSAYRTRRSKDKINAEYPDVNFTGKDGEVLDIPTSEENIIFIEGKEYKRFKHKFPGCPVVIEFNAVSAYLRDEGYMEHEGESIYSSVRDLYEHLFRLVSVFETQNMRSFQHNYQLLSENPEGPNVDFDPDPFSERSVLPMKKGERLEPLSPAELKRSIIYLLNLIETRQQRGTLPPTDYGSVSAPMTGVAIKILGEQRNSKYQPVMDTVARARKRLYRMIIDQWVAKKFSHEDITAPQTNILKSKYKIDVSLSYIPPVENIANYAVAEHASQWMDRETVLAEVLHVQNPQEVMQKKRSEEAEMLSPQLKLWRTAKALLAEGEEIEAAMVAGQLGISLEQLKSERIDQKQAIKAPQPQSQGKREPLMSLFGGSRVAPGAKSSQEEAAEMSKQVEVE